MERAIVDRGKERRGHACAYFLSSKRTHSAVSIPRRGSRERRLEHERSTVVGKPKGLRAGPGGRGNRAGREKYASQICDMYSLSCADGLTVSSISICVSSKHAVCLQSRIEKYREDRRTRVELIANPSKRVTANSGVLRLNERAAPLVLSLKYSSTSVTHE